MLTGASGFLGSHLSKAFVDSGYEVHVLIREASNLHRLAGYEKKLFFHCLEDGFEKIFDVERPYNAIVHTATCYGRNTESATEVFNVNLKFSLELLERSVLFNTGTFFNTDTILHKYLNSYALSKKQFSEWGRLYAEQGKIKFCNIKLEHMYGPGDDQYKFIAYIINSCMSNEPVIKLTPGEQKRDFIYIDDVIRAYQLLVEQKNLENYEEFELGSGNIISIKDLVEKVHVLTNSSSVLDFEALTYRENEAMESKANITRLNRLGWKPVISLEKGLRKIIG